MRLSYLYDIPLPCRFAAPIQILNTARELATLGVVTTLYTGPVQADCLVFYGLKPHENLRLVPLFSSIPWQVDLRWRLSRLVRAGRRHEGPHVIMSRGETGLAVLPRLRRLRLPPATRLVYEAHRLSFAHEAERLLDRRWWAGDPLPARAERIRRRERAAVESADALVCLTQGVHDALAAFGVARPALVLPSGTAVPPAGPAEGGRDIDVIYAGKLEARKGLDLLLEAMRRLPGRSLWVLGGEPEQVTQHRRIADSFGIGDRVVFTGFVEPWRVPHYLRRARVGVCALPTGVSVISEEFTSPLKLLEMMAFGVPVVASNLASVRAIAEHDRTALLTRPDDPADLASAIASILDDPGLADRLGNAARRRAADFSWSTRARRLLDFLEQLQRA